MTQAMLVIIQAGGFQGGGVNFDAKIRRNSTDLEDIFIAHISGMDNFARSFLAADKILEKSKYSEIRTNRYASFDSGKGKDFEDGNLSLTDLATYAQGLGEVGRESGKQEYLESIINQYL